MANHYFQFKQFIIHQDRCAMKVTTDSCLFGAWTAKKIYGNRLAPGTYRVHNVLDIGTGTGLLSLMVAQQCDATIDAIEIDKETYEQAKENIANSPWADRINVIHNDANKYLGATQYDVIISNPPFYENELKSGNNKKNKAHHDAGLLLGDLVTIIQRSLKANGEFYLLLPCKRNEEIENVFAKNELVITHKAMVRQSDQHPYSRILLSGKHQAGNNENITSTDLIIKNERKEYTPEFTSLLKDYYLHL